MRSRGRPASLAPRAGKLLRTASGLALLVGVLAGCFSERPATAPEQPTGGDAVSIQNFAFVPPNLSVASGTTVTWTNTDDVQHGQTFQFTAGAPGTYTYTCRIHPFMHATLTVTAP
jgi:plastocyanin